MKVEVRYLQRHPRTGILYYRRAFPLKLRPHVGDDGGQAELKVSLEVRSLNEPGAKALYDATAARYDAMLAKAQKVASGVYDRLDKPLIKYLADSFVQSHLELDEAGRKRQPPPDLPFETRRNPEADRLESVEMLNAYDTEGLVQYWGDWATSYTRSLGYTFDPSTSDFSALCSALGEASHQLWIVLDERIGGTAVDTPAAPAAPLAVVGGSDPAKPRARPPADNRSLDTIAKELLGNPRLASKFTPGVADHIRTALRFIRETVGTPSPEELNRAAVSSILDLMAQRPVKLPASERELPLPALAKLYAGRPEVRRMSPRTQEVRMSSMSTLWKTAIKEGAIAGDLPNPFVGRAFPEPTRRRKAAKGFSAAELTAYFSLPPFQDGVRPVRGRGEAIFWLPLIALFTGARPEEVAQLLVSDIHMREADGRWVIRFTDEGTHPVKGPQTLKTARHGSGERTFPVPRALKDLGLLDYLAHFTGRGEMALFPLLRLKGRRGDLYPSFGGWFADYVYDHGVLPRSAERQPVREFRHTWTTAARASGIARDAREYLQGRKAPGRGTSDDDYGFTDVLAEQIDRLTFPVDIVALVPRWRLSE
jgi:integrase